jgi:hypothetical protein
VVQVHQLTTHLPAMVPAEALESTRLHRLARCAGRTTPARPMGASAVGPATDRATLAGAIRRVLASPVPGHAS